MYLELRSWKGTWFAGQPATSTRGFRPPSKGSASPAATAGEPVSKPAGPLHRQFTAATLANSSVPR